MQEEQSQDVGTHRSVPIDKSLVRSGGKYCSEGAQLGSRAWRSPLCPHERIRSCPRDCKILSRNAGIAWFWHLLASLLSPNLWDAFFFIHIRFFLLFFFSITKKIDIQNICHTYDCSTLFRKKNSQHTTQPAGAGCVPGGGCWKPQAGPRLQKPFSKWRQRALLFLASGGTTIPGWKGIKLPPKGGNTVKSCLKSQSRPRGQNPFRKLRHGKCVPSSPKANFVCAFLLSLYSRYRL